MTTCRWCNQTGHNIRSCKTRKQWCADVLDDPRSTPGDRLSAQRYIERYDSSESKTRRCKFCKASGHDLRTCPEFREVIDAKADAIWDARRELKKRFEQHSFGPGSLVTCDVRTPKGYVTQKRTVLATVVDIRWHLITEVDLADSPNWHHQRPMRIRPIDCYHSFAVQASRYSCIFFKPNRHRKGRPQVGKRLSFLIFFC